MENELDHQIATGRLYRSRRLKEGSNKAYETAFRAAIQCGNAASFQAAIAPLIRRGAPARAAELLASTEFRRLRLCAICIDAIALGAEHFVQVVRVEGRRCPRASSEVLIGRSFCALGVLSGLRDRPNEIPIGQPNSGLALVVVRRPSCWLEQELAEDERCELCWKVRGDRIGWIHFP